MTHVKIFKFLKLIKVNLGESKALVVIAYIIFPVIEQ